MNAPRVKSDNLIKLHSNWKLVRNRMSVNIIHCMGEDGLSIGTKISDLDE